MTEQQNRPAIASLWVAAHEELADRVSHELRNALNGVAVNLEVVRSRLGRSGVDVRAVAPFAATAATAMEHLSAVSEALLMLARPPRHPTDVGVLLTSIFTVLEPVARQSNETASFRAPATGEGVTGAPADATRLVLLATALEGVRTGASVACTVTSMAPGRFKLLFGGWFPLQLPDAIVSVARGADILLEQDQSDGVRWTFPAYTG